MHGQAVLYIFLKSWMLIIRRVIKTCTVDLIKSSFDAMID